MSRFCTYIVIAAALLLAVPATAQTPPATTPPPASATPPPPASPGAPIAAGDTFAVTTEIEADTPMHVADRATVVIEVTHPAGYTLEAPEQSRLDAGRFRVIDIDSTQETVEDGLVRDTIRLTVTLYRVGRFFLPRLRLIYVEDEGGQRRFVETEPVSAKVVSVVLEELEQAQLRGVRGPATLYQPDDRWMYGGAIAAGVLLLLAIGFLFARRYQARESVERAPYVPSRPAWEVAMERLNALCAEDWPAEEGAIREFYFQLSETIREYLGARYAFESLELTTSELIERIAKYTLPRTVDRIGVENFLLDCDLVKFARYRASTTETAGAHAFAVELVEKTRPRAKAEGQAPPPGKPPEQEVSHAA